MFETIVLEDSDGNTIVRIKKEYSKETKDSINKYLEHKENDRITKENNSLS